MLVQACEWGQHTGVRQRSRFAVLLVLSAVIFVVACATKSSFVADNLYDEPPAPAPLGAKASEVFTRAPWEMVDTAGGRARYHRGARVRLPDSAESFVLAETSVYAVDGSDVQLMYVSAPAGETVESQAVVRVSVYRTRLDLDAEWTRLARRWHQKQSGTLAEPLPLPDDYPPESKRMAWVLPVGDGYEAAAFEEIVLYHVGTWSVRYQINCAAKAKDKVAGRILAFLRWIRAGAKDTQQSG